MRKTKKLLALLLTVVMTILAVPVTPVHAGGEWDEVNHRRWVTCSTCGGIGSKTEGCSSGSTQICSNCGGDGRISGETCGSFDPCPRHGHFSSTPGARCGYSESRSCGACSGSGSRYVVCSICNGTGYKTVSCPTGSYQYDNTAPIVSITKSLDADSPSYTGQAVIVTASASDNLSGVYQYQFNDGSWQSNNTYTVPSTAGSVTVTCVVKDNAGNISSTQSIAVKTMLQQSPLVITPPTSPTYGTGFKLVVTGGTTSKPVVWNVESGNATIDTNGNVTPTGIGTVTITVTMPGNTNYFDVVGTITFNIAPKKITTTGTIIPQDKVYDGNDKVNLDTTLSLEGIVSGDDVSIDSVNAKFADCNVGTDKVVTISPLALSGADKGNYILTQPTLTGCKASVSAKNLNVQDTAIADKIYDGTTTATYLQSPSLIGVVAGDAVTLQGGTPSFKSASKGDNKEIVLAPFVLEGADKGNYSLTQPPTGTANITALQVTVTDVMVKNKVYDGTTTAEYVQTPTLVGVKDSDKVTLVPGTPTFADKSASTHEVSYSPFSLTGTDSENYAIVQPGSTQATITPRELSIKGIVINDKEYDGTTTATAKIELNNVVSGDNITASYNEALFDTASVGVDKVVTIDGITLDGDSKNNYTLSTITEQTTGSITQKVISILPTLKATKVYGTTDPVFTYTHSELIGEDKITGEIARAPGDDVGEYLYLLDKLVVTKNYTLELNPTADKFTITKAKGSVSLTANKTGTAPVDIELSATLPGSDGEVEFYVLGEKIKTVKATSNTVTATYRPLTAGEYTITCKLVGAKNYDDVNSDSVTVSVSAADITVPVLPSPPVTETPKEITTSEPEIKLEVKSNIAVPYTPQLSVPDPWQELAQLEEILPESPQQPDNKIVVDPNLIVIDVTDGVDLSVYTALLEQKHIDKEIIGVYSARLFLGNDEVNPDGTVEVTLPISGRLADFDGHDVFQVTDTLTQVQVKSASATAISFDTDSLGYFAVVGIPTDKQIAPPTIPPQIDWVMIIVWTLVSIAFCGVLFLLFLLWKKKKDEDEEK